MLLYLGSKYANYPLPTAFAFFFFLFIEMGVGVGSHYVVVHASLELKTIPSPTLVSEVLGL